MERERGKVGGGEQEKEVEKVEVSRRERGKEREM